ncbi:LPXTG cell wall anchor domain-containing protein, partial [Secundilactobacillus folii]
NPDNGSGIPGTGTNSTGNNGQANNGQANNSGDNNTTTGVDRGKVPSAKGSSNNSQIGTTHNIAKGTQSTGDDVVKNQVHGEHPQATVHSVQNSITNTKKNGTQHQLPQTSESTNELGTMGALLLGLSSLLGLLGIGKRRKHEDK